MPRQRQIRSSRQNSTLIRLAVMLERISVELIQPDVIAGLDLACNPSPCEKDGPAGHQGVLRASSTGYARGWRL